MDPTKSLFIPPQSKPTGHTKHEKEGFAEIKNQNNTKTDMEKSCENNSNTNSRNNNNDDRNTRSVEIFKNAMLHKAEEAAAEGDVLTVLEIYNKVFEAPFREEQDEQLKEAKNTNNEDVKEKLAQEDIFHWVLLLAEAGEFKKAYRTCERITDSQLAMRIQNMFDLRDLETEWDFGLSKISHVNSETKSFTKQEKIQKLKFRKIPANSNNHETNENDETIENDETTENNERTANNEAIENDEITEKHECSRYEYINEDENQRKVEPSECIKDLQEAREESEEDVTDDLLDPYLPDPRYVSQQKTVLRNFHQWFSGRRDLYAKQWYDSRRKRSGYYPVEAPLTSDVAASHLDGAITIGQYLIFPDGTVSFCALDLDLDANVLSEYRAANGREAVAASHPAIKRYALALMETADNLGLPIFPEDSGNRGLHLWLFLRPRRTARAARTILSTIVASAGSQPPEVSVEIFPKGESLGRKGLSSLIKLPLGVHQVTLRPCPLLDENLQPIKNTAEALERLKSPPKDLVDDILGKRVLSFPAPELAPAFPPPSLPERPTARSLAEALRAIEPGRSEKDACNRMIQGCWILRALVNKVYETHRLQPAEARFLVYTIGLVGPSCKLIEELFDIAQVSFKELHRVRKGLPSPTGCKRLRKLGVKLMKQTFRNNVEDPDKTPADRKITAVSSTKTTASPPAKAISESSPKTNAETSLPNPEATLPNPEATLPNPEATLPNPEISLSAPDDESTSTEIENTNTPYIPPCDCFSRGQSKPQPYATPALFAVGSILPAAPDWKEFSEWIDDEAMIPEDPFQTLAKQLQRMEARLERIEKNKCSFPDKKSEK